MSRLLGHLTKQKRQKWKDVRAARGVKSSVSDAAELWIAPNKQFCFQPSLECRQRWWRSDIGRQTSCGHRKHAVTDCWQARHRHHSLMPSEDTAGRRGPPHTGGRWRGGLLQPTHQCSNVCGLVAEVGSVGFTKKWWSWSETSFCFCCCHCFWFCSWWFVYLLLCGISEWVSSVICPAYLAL